MRFAIYFTPPPDSLLTQLAASWLGRDPFTGSAVQPPSVSTLSPAEIAFHSAPPRRYGFHATLKAPFGLAQGESEAALADAVTRFAERVEPFHIPRLVVGQLDGFFALIPGAPVAELNRFADDVVREFDRFRAPMSEVEIERRNPDALSAEEFNNLHRWGYPYVFESFRFHMTLTGRVGGNEAERIRVALNEVFGETLAAPVPVDGIALFVEPGAGAPFTVHSYCGFGPRRERKTA
jgi:putative phosphonate metabolism protein